MFAPLGVKTQPKGGAAKNRTADGLSKHRHVLGSGPANELPERLGDQETLEPLAQRTAQGTDAMRRPVHEYAPDVSGDFGNVPIFAPGRSGRSLANSSPFTQPLAGVLQRKLAVGRTDDPLEQEADRVAEQVMRMPAAEAATTNKSSDGRDSPFSKRRRSFGNEQCGATALENDLMRVPIREPARGASGDFGKIPIFAPNRYGRSQSDYSSVVPPLPGVLQRKLAVGRTDDPLEDEADRVADQVIRMAAPELTINSSPSQLNRKCAACEKEDEEKAGKLQMKPVGAVTPQAGKAPGIVHEVIESAGQPLDMTTRAFMEPRFGHDFSRVRVHADGAAEQSAREVNANAYTVGHDIVFGAGRFAPASQEGRRLLAHELTHVVQQSSLDGSSAGQSNEKCSLSPTIEAQRRTRAGLLQRSFWGLFAGDDFAEQDLADYLKGLKKRDKIEDFNESDNKARAVVNKNLHRSESIRVKILLIDEMLTGFCGDDDENAILRVLSDLSMTERDEVARTVGLERLYDKFDGEELDKLYVFFPVLDSLHPRRGDKSTTYTMQEYIDLWSKKNGVVMSPAEKKVLARGCIGITALEIGTLGMPDLSNCYESFAEALQAKEKMQAFLTTNQPNRKAIIFSKRFYNENAPPIDKKTGKVDMSGYDSNTRRPGENMTNFDYGLYDETTGNWWHANHCDTATLAEPKCRGPMKVYESTLEHYSRQLGDFNRQIFCVGVAVKR